VGERELIPHNVESNGRCGQTVLPHTNVEFVDAPIIAVVLNVSCSQATAELATLGLSGERAAVKSVQ
jgi:hypothetical protein